jgi:hypothetical protein
MARDLRAATVDSSWLPTSPQDYGAVGDGVADDIKALERAVETAAGGSGLVILSRDYAISRPLTMPRGVRLNGPAGFKRATTTPWAVTNGVVRPHRGWSGDALLVYGGGDDDANPHGAVIDGISVVGRDFARDAYPDLVGICVVNTRDVRISNSYIGEFDRTGNTGRGIKVVGSGSGSAYGTTVHNCVLSACYEGMLLIGDGVTDQRVSDTLFTGCTRGFSAGFDDSGGSDVNLGGGGTQMTNTHFTYTGMPSGGWHLRLGSQAVTACSQTSTSINTVTPMRFG